MATITPQTQATSNVPGLALNMVAVTAAGDEVVLDGNPVILVRNGHATLPRTVTLDSQLATPPEGAAAADLAIVIPAGKLQRIGPLNRKAWANVNGRIALAYSDSGADLTIGAYKG